VSVIPLVAFDSNSTLLLNPDVNVTLWKDQYYLPFILKDIIVNDLTQDGTYQPFLSWFNYFFADPFGLPASDNSTSPILTNSTEPLLTEDVPSDAERMQNWIQNAVVMQLQSICPGCVNLMQLQE